MLPIPQHASVKAGLTLPDLMNYKPSLITSSDCGPPATETNSRFSISFKKAWWFEGGGSPSELYSDRRHEQVVEIGEQNRCSERPVLGRSGWGSALVTYCHKCHESARPLSKGMLLRQTHDGRSVRWLGFKPNQRVELGRIS